LRANHRSEFQDVDRLAKILRRVFLSTIKPPHGDLKHWEASFITPLLKILETEDSEIVLSNFPRLLNGSLLFKDEVAKKKNDFACFLND
jgi:hypothetical protein